MLLIYIVAHAGDIVWSHTCTPCMHGAPVLKVKFVTAAKMRKMGEKTLDGPAYIRLLVCRGMLSLTCDA